MEKTDSCIEAVNTLHVKVGYYGKLSRKHIHQFLIGQGQNRLPDRRSADIKIGGYAAVHKFLPRHQCAVDNPVSQRIINKFLS